MLFSPLTYALAGLRYSITARIIFANPPPSMLTPLGDNFSATSAVLSVGAARTRVEKMAPKASEMLVAR